MRLALGFSLGDRGGTLNGYGRESFQSEFPEGIYLPETF